MASPHSTDSSSDSSANLSPTYSSPRPRHSRLNIAHPYARLYAKKEEVKRRKIWNHALEKSLFTPFEISTIGAPQRRTIYIASLEAHIDKLHAQLLEIGFWPVPVEELKPYHGLNSKTAKSIVSGLQHDASLTRLKMLELERANKSLNTALLPDTPPHSAFAPSYPVAPVPQPTDFPVNVSEQLTKHYSHFSS